MHTSNPRVPQVTFNPVVTTASGSTTQLHPGHGSDSDDPFVGSGTNTRSTLFSSETQVRCT